MATTADLNIVRDWVGLDDPTDGAIEVLVDEMGSPLLAAQRILKRRKADLEATVPFSVTGFTQGSPSASLSSITEKLEALEVAIAGGDPGTGAGGVSTGFLTRADRCRR